jgi:mRNA-degrading endonuclease YafQ of YafQ-DinJ toxin-antitoxin module
MEKVLLEIHQTRRFAKRLVSMAKAGKNERIVAERAQRIIADLQTNPLHGEAECKRTRHGELRLNDCRKYDLSCGFRLIALKRERRLIFSYIGSHDDCQRWIENNRYYQDEIESVPVPLTGGTQSEPFATAEPEHDAPEKDEYEEQLMAKIDERLLREIFAGLYKNDGARQE